MATFQQNRSIAAAVAAMKIGKIQTMFLGNKTGRKHKKVHKPNGWRRSLGILWILWWREIEWWVFLPSFLRFRKGSFDFVDGVDRQAERKEKSSSFWCTKSTADHLQNYTTRKKKKKKQEEEGTTTSSSSSSSLLFFSYILKLHKEEELQELLLLQQDELHQQLQALWALLVLCRFVRGDGFWSCKCRCCCCTWTQNKATKVALCLLLLLL